MKLIEKKMNLFEAESDYYLAHCISADYEMGAGIAVEFQKKFKLRNRLQAYGGHFPHCIRIGKVFNLVTKKRYFNKPTYDQLRGALISMRLIIDDADIDGGITKIAMPKIGCGLDHLSWLKVREMINDVFSDIDNLEILVCHL